MSDTAPKPPSASELKAEIEKVRAELTSTLDEVSMRLTPQYQAAKFTDAVKLACSDATGICTGKGMPEDETRKRNALILISVGCAVTATLALEITRIIRRK